MFRLTGQHNYVIPSVLCGLKSLKTLSASTPPMTVIVATCLPTDSCLLNRHGNVTKMSRKCHGKVTERSWKASVGRQGDSIIQQPTHHPKTFLTLPEALPPSVIPFWKPLMTPNLNPNSDAKILQIFLQPIFATPEYENFQRPYPQVLYLFGNL